MYTKEQMKAIIKSHLNDEELIADLADDIISAKQKAICFDSFFKTLHREGESILIECYDENDPREAEYGI